MSSYDILIRPYLPSSIDAVSGMANSILTASNWYRIGAGAIAGALALEQNNAEQFSVKYALGNFAVGDSFGEAQFSSDDIYGMYKTAQANGTAQNPSLLNKFFNQVNFDTGPARIRIALAISLVEQSSPNDPVLGRYKGRYDALVDNLIAGNSDLTASLIGAYLKQGVAYFESHLGDPSDPSTGFAAWNGLSKEEQNALLVQFYNQGVGPDSPLAKGFAQAMHDGHPWHPRLGDGGALYAFPGNAAAIARALRPRCFPATTLIQTSTTASTPISALRIGDTVLAFDPTADLGRGALVPRRVIRLFRNTTTDWIKLTWMDNGAAKELVATPGHNMLTKHGGFSRLDAMVAGKACEIVLASGDCIMAKAERLDYSAATAGLFEQATAMAATSGALAIAPQALDAWATYNFEVEDLHTYVAGGVRVHNDSLYAPVTGLGNLADNVAGQISDFAFGKNTIGSVFAGSALRAVASTEADYGLTILGNQSRAIKNIKVIDLIVSHNSFARFVSRQTRRSNLIAMGLLEKFCKLNFQRFELV